jgi:hypothetical protein
LIKMGTVTITTWPRQIWVTSDIGGGPKQAVEQEPVKMSDDRELKASLRSAANRSTLPLPKSVPDEVLLLDATMLETATAAASQVGNELTMVAEASVVDDLQTGRVYDASFLFVRSGQIAGVVPTIWRYRWPVIAVAALLIVALTLAGVFLRVSASIGTIVLEVDQPDIMGAVVAVDGQPKITITTADSPESIEMRADEQKHALEVTKGGFQTFSQEFTVKAGRRETIRVRLKRTSDVASLGGEADPNGTASIGRSSLDEIQPLIAASVNSSASIPIKVNWVKLFDGESLNGWQIEDASESTWTLENGVIVGRGVGPTKPKFILTGREYANFLLRLEFSLDEGSQSAIAIRAKPGEKMPHRRGRFPNHPVLDLSNSPQKWRTHWIARMDLLPDPPPELGPAGSWNRLEIEASGREFHVAINGIRSINKTIDPGIKLLGGGTPALNRTAGRIGLQCSLGTVRFRNIEILELGAKVP